MDSVGDNPITIANTAFARASARQFSGVRLSISGMLLQTPLAELCGSCTLSCWLRVPAADAGITATIGNLAAKSGVVVQKNPMADGNWHHVAFTRQPRSCCWAGTSFCFCEYSVQDSVQNRVM